MANDYIKFSRTEFEVVGGMPDVRYARFDPEHGVDFRAGYLSPVSDAYKKVGLFKEKNPFRQGPKRPD